MRSAIPSGSRIAGELAKEPSPRPCGSLAGVLRQERQGTTKLTSLRREDLDARFPGLLDSVLASTPTAA
jgi:hypothetical protein